MQCLIVIFNEAIMIIILLILIKKGITQIKFSVLDFIALIFVDSMELILYGIIGIISMGQPEVYEYMKIYNLVIIVIMYIIAIYCIFARKYIKYMKSAESRKENYYNMQMKYFEQYKKAQDNTRRIKHDMKNHLYVLRTMIKNEEAVTYIDNIVQNIILGQVKYFTGNTTLDAILNSKSEYISNNNIVFKLDGNFQEKLLIEPFAICTIFGNAIDNAIEAVCKVNEKDRYINFTIRNVQGFWSIKIFNSFVETVDINKGIILSSKENINEHGYGINNMKREIENNNGNLNIGIYQNEFQLKIILPNKF